MFYIKDMLDRKLDNNSDDIYLLKSNWDDFGYRTTFSVLIYRDDDYIDIGSIKISFRDSSNFQCDENGHSYIADSLEASFKKLPDEYISLGQDLSYYQKFDQHIGSEELKLLNDIVINKQYDELLISENHNAFQQSLNRFFSRDTYNQVLKFLKGKKIFETYKFEIYNYKNSTMTFVVDPESILPTNVHAIIGSNGVGKTKLLESIVNSYNKDIHSNLSLNSIDSNFENSEFERLLFITTSIFSKLNRLDEVSENDYKFNYVNFNSNRDEFIHYVTNSIIGCKSKGRERLLILSLDKISINQSLKATTSQLKEIFYNWHFRQIEINEVEIKNIVDSLSSGNMMTLYIIANLVQLVQQKALILIDEPETHMHPTLLSAIIGVINKIAKDYNAMVIIATHSPVVLQEIPKNCVWKIFETKIERPIINTFGENVGIITRDVYGLESQKSGFVDFIQNTNLNELIEVQSQFGSEAIFEFLAKRDEYNEK